MSKHSNHTRVSEASRATKLAREFCLDVDGKGTPCPALINKDELDMPRCKNRVALSAIVDSTVWTTDEIQERVERMNPSPNCERLSG